MIRRFDRWHVSVARLRRHDTSRWRCALPAADAALRSHLAAVGPARRRWGVSTTPEGAPW